MELLGARASDRMSAHHHIPLPMPMPMHQQHYLDAFVSLEGDVPGRLAAQRYLDASTAIYHGEVITMGFIPQVYDTQELCHFQSIADDTYAILCKMTQRYLEDASYRALFGFSPLLEYLTLLPAGYDCLIPMIRIDLFFDRASQQFKFCEFNTDGASAMNEDREICNALALSPTFKKAVLDTPLYAQELFDPWVETFCALYTESCHGKDSPVVAIIDYMEKTTINELLEFRARFEAQGVRCLICDTDALVYKNGVLYGTDIDSNETQGSTSVRIDVVYRRAVTSDIMLDLTAQGIFDPAQIEGKKDAKGSCALIAAVRDEAVCVIGGFRTHVVHSKTAFRMLHHPATTSYLTADERQFVADHVPYTTELTSDQLAIQPAVLTDRDRWIIKPIDGYGSVGVHAGLSFSDTEWEATIQRFVDTGYILQEYCTQYPTPNTLPVPRNPDTTPLFDTPEAARHAEQDLGFSARTLQPFNVLTGLFMYGGTFRGVYIRAGMNALIVGFQGGITLGTYVCADNAAHMPGTPLPSQESYSATNISNLSVRLRHL